MSKEQVIERLRELFELEHLMKEFAEFDETGVYERKAASYDDDRDQLKETLRKVAVSLPFDLRTPSRTWAADLERRLDEKYDHLRILDYRHPMWPTRIFCCPVRLLSGPGNPIQVMPWKRTYSDRYKYYHMKQSHHYWGNLFIPNVVE